MSDQGKVLTGLMERRALEADFRALAEPSDRATLTARAEAIAERGTEAVLPMLLTLLDTGEPHFRGGLGQVAALLDHDLMVAALRSVARSREHSDQARLSALTILERFLHEPIDETLVAGWHNPDAAAMQSLRELIGEMNRSPVTIIEYLNQLAQQPPDVPKMILDAVPQLLPNPHLVTLLRMFAQSDNSGLAQGAVEQLGRIRQPDAFAALTSLAATLPPALAALADRGARKLRMSGFAAPPSDSTAWRALLSPIDGTGAQVIWLVRHADGEPTGALLGLLAQDPLGIMLGFGSPEVPAATLPPVQPVGTLHPVAPRKDLPAVPMLEAPFETGRAAMRRALEQNWASHTPTPLEYRFVSGMIWEVPWRQDVGIGERTGERVAESPAAALPPATPAATATLLDHPFFLGWFAQMPEVTDAAHRLGSQPNATERNAVISSLAEAAFGPAVRASYRRRLAGMAEWLTLAGEPEVAALAGAAASEVATVAPSASPFIRRLIGISFDLVAGRLRRKPRLRRTK